MGYKLSILLRRLALARKSLQWVKAGLACTERTHPNNSLAPPGRSLVTMGGEGEESPIEIWLTVADLPGLGVLTSLAPMY